MFFSISEAIKIAVSFSKFQCLYAMLPLEITQNMVLQLLKNFKVEINFGRSHVDKNIS